MVSARPPPSPANGRIPYPSAASIVPGEAGKPPESAPPQPDMSKGSSTTAESSTSALQPATGLQRLRSMRDRVRDRSRDRSERNQSGRDRSGSVAVAMLGQNRDKGDKEKDALGPGTPTTATATTSELEREKSTQGLKSWWKAFSGASRSSTPSPPPYQPSFRNTGAATTTMSTRKVFGAPLSRVLSYAAMQITTSGPDGHYYVWGEVPIIVGRCGAYLKTKADIEGIFRVSGSAKRMRDLQAIFDDGPTYGSELDWETSQFTPHDVATIFRRFMTQMPESVIPLAYYDQFRKVQSHQPPHPDEMKIREYKRLIRALPKENRFLLLYTLDLLGVVDQLADKNLMNAANLALIFAPGLLSHPGHDLRPAESALSKDVVEFLIKHQHHFVMSMAMKSSRRRTHGRSDSTSLPSKVQTPPPVVDLGRSSMERRGSAGSSQTCTTVPEESPAEVQLDIPQAIPENGQLSPPQSPSPISESTLRSPVPLIVPPEDRPKAVRADTDYLMPSDSDEEPPPGGYYIVEKPRTTSPAPPTPTSLASPGHAPFSVQELISPPRPNKSTKRGRPTLPNLTVPMEGGVPAVDVMVPSDSDDDAPVGGYVVYENKRSQSARPSSSSPTPVGTPTLGAMGLARSQTQQPAPSRSARNAFQSAEGRTNSPKPSGGGATGLLRRKTLPTKRVSDFTARMRRAVRDA